MIEIKRLHKSFEDNEVLRGVDLTIGKGHTTAIIGSSGSGKSVLLKHIMGLMKPDAGCVFLNGTCVTDLSYHELKSVRKKMAMVFQGAALFDSMTVSGNVGIGLYNHTDMKEKEIRKRVTECLERVGLHGIEQLSPAELSGGMKKRVAIARAIAMKPQILLYDEPTTGLDPIRANSINDLIVDLQEEMDVTSIVVTHDMNSVERTADYVAFLHNGQIHFEGTVEELSASDDIVLRNFVEGVDEVDKIAA
ncbi:ABC transporter ATP-binding protein [candidate division KSB1 bacterium]|nr:ABC transporter ATP-binding protein [candidate division KSB1 bacterium]NIR71158.1 ABC transporter ATP-binding protein [candidate division KSB1 bacterium]NIS23288.1 ABC transporter ATP-binding protein [candidate division KSB1 bacterium]NIT70167.1 ABC transporter ATP-binding protein [candidate division KSB1 bacterium]NIU23818.1 ABC transporter ATP-binding protein [candidate division KSB1 bacterium]